MAGTAFWRTLISPTSRWGWTPVSLKNKHSTHTAPEGADTSFFHQLPPEQRALYSLMLALGFIIPSPKQQRELYSLTLTRNKHLIHSVYKSLQSGNNKTRLGSVTSMDLDMICLYLGNPTMDTTVTPGMRAFVLMRIAQYLGFQHGKVENAIQYCEKAEEIYAGMHNSSKDHNMLRVSNLSMCAFFCYKQGRFGTASIRIQRAQNIVNDTEARKSKNSWVLSHICFMESVSAAMDETSA